MRVLELGAAPGGWTRFLEERLRGGLLIACDSRPITAGGDMVVIEGEYGEAATDAAIDAALGTTRLDLVLSDMAPNLSGVKDADQARHYGLAELALEFAVQWLKPEGMFVVKVFQGAGFEDFVRAARQAFRQVQVRKPEASRDESRENFLVAKGLKV